MLDVLKEIIYKILVFLGIINEEAVQNKNEPLYSKKALMTKCEKDFYNKLLDLKNDYEIMPQVNLATIIKRLDKTKYHNELFRNVDFGIFSKNYEELVLLIELNDSSHKQYNRTDRDLKVKKICNDANIKLITFYTNYPNEKDYVINRIKKEIDEHKI